MVSEDDYEYSTDQAGYSVEADGDDMDWSNEEGRSCQPGNDGNLCLSDNIFLCLHRVTMNNDWWLISVIATAGYKPGIRSLKAEDLRPVMQRRIGDVSDILGVSPGASAVLLREYKFSKEQLLEEYMLSPDHILKKAGVFHRCGNTKSPPPNSKDCAICYDDECDGMMAMPCGHQFCMDCWNDFWDAD